jgi:hypothetical protein
MAQRMIPLDLALSPQLAEQRRRELGLTPTGVQDDEERKMMQMMEQMQQRRAPNAAIAMKPQAQQQMKNFEAARRQALKPPVSVAGGSTTAKPEQPGLMSRIARRGMDVLQDPVANAQLVTALNTLRFEPDPQLAKAVQTRAAGVQERRQQAQTANRTAQHLKQIGQAQLAQMVEADPTLASEALAMAYGVGGVSDKFFAPQTDPETGEVYVVRVNPNTGKVERVAVPGTTQLTPQEKAELETTKLLVRDDYQKAQKAGVDAFRTYDLIQNDLRSYQQVLDALDQGANTGPLISRLPTLSAATANLEQAATQLGLGVISSVTFGALSESELNLAMKTPLNTNLPPDELRKQVLQIMAARAKLAEELRVKAETLVGGTVKFSEYIKSLRLPNQALTEEAKEATPSATPSTRTQPPPPPGFTQASWDLYWSNMTPEQRRAF